MPFSTLNAPSSGLSRSLARRTFVERRGDPRARLRSGADLLKPGDPEDRQARYIEAAVNGVLIASLYLPNGHPQPGPKFNYKLAWFERLITHAAELMAAGVPILLAGDYNVVPTVQDIYQTLAQGWTDALRRLQPDGPLWTFWGYKRERWAADKGMRLDHLLLSPELRERLVDGGVDRWVGGEENASDHAPGWIVLDR